jgi:hypothetical protein
LAGSNLSGREFCVCDKVKTKIEKFLILVIEENTEVDNKASTPVVRLKSGRKGPVKWMGH